MKALEIQKQINVVKNEIENNHKHCKEIEKEISSITKEVDEVETTLNDSLFKIRSAEKKISELYETWYMDGVDAFGLKPGKFPELRDVLLPYYLALRKTEQDLMINISTAKNRVITERYSAKIEPLEVEKKTCRENIEKLQDKVARLRSQLLWESEDLPASPEVLIDIVNDIDDGHPSDDFEVLEDSHIKYVFDNHPVYKQVGPDDLVSSYWAADHYFGEYADNLVAIVNKVMGAYSGEIDFDVDATIINFEEEQLDADTYGVSGDVEISVVIYKK